MRAFGATCPEQLSALKKVATIESIGSSTRVEGSKLSDQEVEALLSNLSIQKFESRDQQKVAGYSPAMNLVFQYFKIIPFPKSYLQQLQNELLQYSGKDNWHKGAYKKSPNHVKAFAPGGKSIGIVVETATPFETPIRMQNLITWTNEVFDKKILYPLLIMAAFIVEFLAIHPFQDGNGRLSPVITTYLLLRCGYGKVPYSSPEAVIEHSKENYYHALRQTQGTIKSDSPNWQPWTLFFLKALKQQKQRLKVKLEREKLLMGQLPELSLKIPEITKSRRRITVKNIVYTTGANRNSVKKYLKSLVGYNYLQQNALTKDHGTHLQYSLLS